MGLSFCQIIAAIEKDPLAKVDISIRQFYELQAHVKVCPTCIAITDEILEKYKDVPSAHDDPTRYN